MINYSIVGKHPIFKISEFLIRQYDITLLRLEKFKEKGFDPAQVDIILSTNTDRRKEMRLLKFIKFTLSLIVLFM